MVMSSRSVAGGGGLTAAQEDKAEQELKKHLDSLAQQWVNPFFSVNEITGQWPAGH